MAKFGNCPAFQRSEPQIQSIGACVTRPQRCHLFLGLVLGLRCRSSTRLRWIGIQYPKLISSDASLQTPKKKQTIHRCYTIQSIHSVVSIFLTGQSDTEFPLSNGPLRRCHAISPIFFYTNNKHLHWSIHRTKFSTLCKGSREIVANAWKYGA